MPGAPLGVGPPARAAGGRGALCMPCVDENGLLPGRAPGAFGPGRGPGVAGAEAAAAGASGSAAGASGAGASATGSGSGAGATRGPGVGPGLRVGEGAAGAAASTGAGAASGWGSASAALAGAVGAAPACGDFLAAGLPPDFLAPCARRASPCSSLRRRTTGASTVEEADFTYSPMSFRVDRTTLLSTPNSRASSWTLTATLLLQGGPTPKEDQTTS